MTESNKRQRHSAVKCDPLSDKKGFDTFTLNKMCHLPGIYIKSDRMR